MGAGVLAEGAASWAMARSSVRDLKRQRDEDCAFGLALTTASIRKFYAPGPDVVPFVLHQPADDVLPGPRPPPIESLAVLPVVVGLAFIFRTAGIALQEVVIARVDDDPRSQGRLARFSLRIGSLATLGLAVLVLTPLSRLWYRVVSGLSPNLRLSPSSNALYWFGWYCWTAKAASSGIIPRRPGTKAG